ncbi:MAG: DNA-binding protein [Rhodoferax sp.]|nr:DNA-binding protein [Rhodoferax sp.]
MRCLPLRLVPGNDLRLSLEALARQAFPDGAFVLSGIGSLGDAQLRLAGAEQATRFAGEHEILTLCGSITPQGAHLHMAVASATGEVRGGHLVAGNLVRTTDEELLVEAQGWRLSRVPDAGTGYLELAARRAGE